MHSLIPSHFFLIIELGNKLRLLILFCKDNDNNSLNSPRSVIKSERINLAKIKSSGDISRRVIFFSTLSITTTILSFFFTLFSDIVLFKSNLSPLRTAPLILIS